MLHWIQSHVPPWVYIAVISHFLVLGTVAYLILLERKVASWVQDRIGPNRVGLGFGLIPWLKDKKMFGLGQPLADGMKFIFKEDYRPRHVDVLLFTIAPIVMITVIIISIATLPVGGVVQHTVATADVPWWTQWFGTVADLGNGTSTYAYKFQMADLNIGVLYILAVLSLAVYGVVIGGWASNNKYSFLGGLRATANMISYEIPLGLAVLSIVVLYGTLKLDELVALQAHNWLGVLPAWNVFTQPLAFLMFLICIHAEANRAPFDVAEAEQELVGGYHTEYSSMRFALFFLAEYAGMITTSAICVALFFGGWDFPGLRGPRENPALTDSVLIAVLRGLVFFGKTLAIVFIFMWTRWSLPRFRFDQIMQLAWRALIPISLGQLLITAFVLYFFRGQPRSPQAWGGLEVGGRLGLTLLVANGALLVLTMLLSRVVPAAPDTNRKMHVAGSRYLRTPLPATSTGVLPLDRGEVEQVAVDGAGGIGANSGRMGA
ncbi:MAG TPA: NADH-quinone oxidoreductase subunit NuoH [Tepidisphaeraceae bacterium]|nr:NADH-quinone oxidoreductase subunit NuoH [Tepidisphaeraceae bacterium]